jgi:hypothetical protein
MRAILRAEWQTAQPCSRGGVCERIVRKSGPSATFVRSVTLPIIYTFARPYASDTLPSGPAAVGS